MKWKEPWTPLDKWLIFILSIVAILCILINDAQGITVGRPVEIELPTNADTLRLCYVKISASGIDTVLTVDSVRCTDCAEWDSTFTITLAGDTLHLITAYIVYPGCTPANMIFTFDELLRQVRVGDGLDTLTITAYDTCTPATVQGAYISVVNAADYTVENVTTGPGGTGVVVLDSGSTYEIRVHGPAGHVWTRQTYVHDYDTVTVKGCAVGVPGAAPGPDYVMAYIDIGTAMIDSVTGDMIPRTRLELKLNLIGEVTLNDGSWAYLPQTQTKKPDAAGRVGFYIPANTMLTPSGSYYELSYRSLDSRTLTSGIIRRFQVDTIPDPINILNATEVAP